MDFDKLVELVGFPIAFIAEHNYRHYEGNKACFPALTLEQLLEIAEHGDLFSENGIAKLLECMDAKHEEMTFTQRVKHFKTRLKYTRLADDEAIRMVERFAHDAKTCQDWLLFCQLLKSIEEQVAISRAKEAIARALILSESETQNLIDIAVIGSLLGELSKESLEAIQKQIIQNGDVTADQLIELGRTDNRYLLRMAIDILIETRMNEDQIAMLAVGATHNRDLARKALQKLAERRDEEATEESADPPTDAETPPVEE